jgi:DNA-binding GntR family transcriptional regulator
VNEPAPIRTLPVPDHIDADYAPQYVKVARILRDRIKFGGLGRFTVIRAADLNAEFGVSAQVAYATLEMLAANRYVSRPGKSRCYRVTWDPVIH